MDKATVLNRVYAANLPSRAKTIMFYLVNRANKELTCFPAIPRIAKETGMSERTVQRALKELCTDGYLEKSPRYRENGGQSSNLYVLLIKGKTKPCDSSNNAFNNVDKTELKKTELAVESLYKNALKESNDINNIIGFHQQMHEINFSSFNKDSRFKDCHRGSDNCVPP